jgi:nitroreductase
MLNPTIDVMRAHRSIRKFKKDPIAREILETILSAAQCAATSNHVQAYTIIQVNNPGVRQTIAGICGDQVWIVQAPVFLVFCADLNRLQKACERHAKEMVQGYAEQFVVATVDTALIGQNTLLAAESLNLGGVFIGAVRNAPQRICELLQIPKQAYPVFGMCLGYPDDDPPTKPRLPLEAILRQETYTSAGTDTLLDAYDEITRQYYRIRDSNLKDETWSHQMAEFMSKVIRPHMKEFLHDRGFFLK